MATAQQRQSPDVCVSHHVHVPAPRSPLPDPMSTAVVTAARPLSDRKHLTQRPAASLSHVPDDIRDDAVLNAAIAASLPENYNFEVHKIVWRLRQTGCSRVGLQFPEGLFVFAVPLVRILETFAGVEVLVFGDVTYGACCVDDFTARALRCDFLVHFAHSCLIPVTRMLTGLKVMYVFVDIKFDAWHLIESVKHNFNSSEKIALASTIQFVATISGVRRELESSGYSAVIPQIKPLSKGEVLGCTSPKLDPDVQNVVFVADGRFHLEAMQIANPQIRCFHRYDPYSKKLTREYYEFDKMIEMRRKAVAKAKESIRSGGTIAFLLSSLGRQGSPRVFNRLREKISQCNPNCVLINVIVPEIQPALLNAFRDSVHVWVQVACPRLSIDWGDGFVAKPLLTPYELNVALDLVPAADSFVVNAEYPMDFYAWSSIGDWTPSHRCGEKCDCER